MVRIRISLDEIDFEALASGGIVTHKYMPDIEVYVALQDIGYDLMLEIIERKRREMMVKHFKEHDE